MSFRHRVTDELGFPRIASEPDCREPEPGAQIGSIAIYPSGRPHILFVAGKHDHDQRPHQVVPGSGHARRGGDRPE